MKIFLKTGFIILLFICSFLKSGAQGREVTIILNNGKQKSGELLSVRDSIVAVLKTSVEKDEDIASHPEKVEIIFLNDIDKVRLEKVEISGAGKGALIGGGIGLATDIILFSIYKPEQTVVMAATPIGALYGTIIGWAVASFMSEDEKQVRPSVANGLKNIREYARFQENEPRYVRDIIDNLLKETK